MGDDEEYMVFGACGHEIKGTYEQVTARSEIGSFFPDDDGGWAFEHEGYTEIFYDAMTTVQKDGEDVFLCEQGEEMKRSQCDLRIYDSETGEYVAVTKELGL